MKYTYEIQLKAVKSIKRGILIDEPYNKISRQWRDRVKYWEKKSSFNQQKYSCKIYSGLGKSV